MRGAQSAAPQPLSPLSAPSPLSPHSLSVTRHSPRTCSGRTVSSASSSDSVHGAPGRVAESPEPRRPRRRLRAPPVPGGGFFSGPAAAAALALEPLIAPPPPPRWPPPPAVAMGAAGGAARVRGRGRCLATPRGREAKQGPPRARPGGETEWGCVVTPASPPFGTAYPPQAVPAPVSHLLGGLGPVRHGPARLRVPAPVVGAPPSRGCTQQLVGSGACLMEKPGVT